MTVSPFPLSFLTWGSWTAPSQGTLRAPSGSFRAGRPASPGTSSRPGCSAHPAPSETWTPSSSASGTRCWGEGRCRSSGIRDTDRVSMVIKSGADEQNIMNGQFDPIISGSGSGSNELRYHASITQKAACPSIVNCNRACATYLLLQRTHSSESPFLPTASWFHTHRNPVY